MSKRSTKSEEHSKVRSNYLVEKHIIKNTHPFFKELDNLCFLSKNLYNSTLYAIRQFYFKEEKYLTYNNVNKQFTHSKQVDYVALPAKVSKQTQMLVDKAYKSFFALRKHEDPEIAKAARPPKYLKKNGRQVVHYEKGALSLVKQDKKGEQLIKLSKTNIVFKTKIQRKNIEFVRLVPCGNHVVIEVGYKVNYPKLNNNTNRQVQQVQRYQRFASIDIGLNNLATMTSNVFAPLIINGRPLKSINQYANKEDAKERSKLDTGLKTSTKRKDRIWLKRKNKINNYLHKSSNIIVNYLASNNIDTLVIGKNDGWKQDMDMGKVNNQNFHFVPFMLFIHMLEYKCRLKGIRVIIMEESYTSKCSFMDDEDICKHESAAYLGKRIKRGMFQSNNGTLINADVNASANILKKYLQSEETWNSQLRLDLVEMCSTSSVQKITPHY